MIRFTVLLMTILCLCSCRSFRLPEPKPWTPTEKTLAAASVGATVLNYISTTKMLDNPNNHERNFYMGKRPSDLEVGLWMGFTETVVLTAAHYCPWPWLRKLLLLGKTTVNIRYSIHDFQME